MNQEETKFIVQSKESELLRIIHSTRKKILELYEKVMHKYLKDEIENDSVVESSKRNTKELDEKVKKEKELEMLKIVIGRITKFEQELMNLSSEEWQKINELMSQGFTLEDAIQAIRNNRES
jgi:leucyl aminopeptidase (aminopeptidase T)